MAGFKKPASGGPAPKQAQSTYTQRASQQQAPRSSGNYQRGKSQQGGEADSSRVAGMFRREGKNGVFWSSPIMDDGYRYTLNLNENYESDPTKQNEFILRKVKVPDEVLNKK